MSLRYVVPLLVAAVLAFACGPRSHSSEPPARKDVASGPPVATSVNVTVGSDVHFAFHVTNNSDKRIEINFPNGQTHDIVVLDSAGRSVWRWSDGRMFTQSMLNKQLDARETMRYEERWAPRTQWGKFTAVVSLKSANYPLEQRVEFAFP